MTNPTHPTSGLALAAAAGVLALILGCAPAAQPPREVSSAGEQPKPTDQQQSDAMPKETQGGSKYGGVLVLLLNQAGDPPSFDLHQESTSSVTEAAGPSYDNLIRFDPASPDEIVPDLAEKWEVDEDGTSYTFTLRKGVKFHNSNPFTSADVKFTLERVMDPPKGVRSPRRTAFAPVTSVETPSDYTVVITLERPYPSLLANLAQGWMAVYDKEWVEEKGQSIPEKELMGTGPFKLQKYARGTEIIRVRNDDYWKEGLPYMNGVKHFIVPEPSTRLAALRTGQVHLNNLWANDFLALKEELEGMMTFSRTGALSFGSLYMNAEREPFDNPKVREAINLAVNRHDAIKLLAQGDGLIGGYMRPGGPWSLTEEELLMLPGYGRDKTEEIEQARKLLAEANFPDGFDVQVKTRQGQSYSYLSTFIADQLKKIGIKTEVKSFETAQAYDIAYKGDYELLAWSHRFSLDDPDAVYNEFYLCDAPRNWSKLCTSEVGQLFMKQSSELDPAKRKELVMELERTAVPTASKVITHWNMSRIAAWSFVRNYVAHPSVYNNIRFDQVWLDQ